MPLINRNIVFAIGLFALYWTAAYFLDFWTLHEIVSSLAIGLSAGVVFLYIKEAYAAIKEKIPDRAYQLVLGIVLFWSSAFFNRLYHLWWRGSGQYIDDINTDLVTFFTYGLVVSAILCLTVPGAINGKIPRRQWAYVSIAFGLGVALAVYLIVTNYGSTVISPDALPIPQRDRSHPSSGDAWFPHGFLRLLP